MEQPLVSVPVITYNSSKFVLETLESIKAQTYQNIELIISDDCSTDNTVELCQEWVEQNKVRFVRTQIITSELNTGVSANLNRAEAACQGEWVKGIAGDDLLMPDCIEQYISYVQLYPNTTYLFGRVETFGGNEESNRHFMENVFDFTFFDLDIDVQLRRLIYGENCIPASTLFYNRNFSIDNGIINDERIPLLEDWPKWIRLLELGVRFKFLDKKVVKYRLHKNSLSTNKFSINYYQSVLLFELYYRYPRWQNDNADNAIKHMVEIQLNTVKELWENMKYLEQQNNKILTSHSYKLGKKIISLFHFFN